MGVSEDKGTLVGVPLGGLFSVWAMKGVLTTWGNGPYEAYRQMISGFRSC